MSAFARESRSDRGAPRGRLRRGLLRRLVIGVGAITAYLAVALLAAVVLPAGWPAIGATGYSDAQATIVPALNVFGLTVIVLCVVGPVVPAAVRVAVAAVIAVAAAVIGPMLAVADGTIGSGAIVPVGTAVLAIAGAAIGVALALLVGPSARRSASA